MPLYDYKCANGCGKIYEIHVRLDKTGKDIACPNCGKVLVRQIGAPAIHWR